MCVYEVLHRGVHKGVNWTTIFAWWRHQMETFSALLALCVGNTPVPGDFPSQRPVTRSIDVFLISAWTHGWVNNRGAGELRRHRTHYNVTVLVYVTTGGEFYFGYAVKKNSHDSLWQPPVVAMKVKMTSWYEDMFCVVGPLWGEPPVTGTISGEIWCFLCFPPE